MLHDATVVRPCNIKSAPVVRLSAWPGRPAPNHREIAMGLLKSALGIKQSDEEWRELETRYGGGHGPTQQVEGRRRRLGEYEKTRDQLIQPDD